MELLKLRWYNHTTLIMHCTDTLFGEYIVNKIKVDVSNWKCSPPYGDTSPMSHRKPIHRMEESVIQMWKQLINTQHITCNYAHIK
jgi:hypothetical protein